MEEKMVKVRWVVLVAALSAAGCVERANYYDSIGTTLLGTTLEDLEIEARRTAGPNALDCGTTQIGADRSQTNCCVASNYSQSLPTYAVYMEQGIDTVEATAVAVNNVGEVTYLAFHGDLGDFEEPWEGEIVTAPCASPTLTQDVCSNPTARPFNCS